MDVVRNFVMELRATISTIRSNSQNSHNATCEETELDELFEFSHEFRTFGEVRVAQGDEEPRTYESSPDTHYIQWRDQSEVIERILSGSIEHVARKAPTPFPTIHALVGECWSCEGTRPIATRGAIATSAKVTEYPAAAMRRPIVGPTKDDATN